MQKMGHQSCWYVTDTEQNWNSLWFIVLCLLFISVFLPLSVYSWWSHCQDIWFLLESQWTLGDLFCIRRQYHASLANGKCFLIWASLDKWDLVSLHIYILHQYNWQLCSVYSQVWLACTLSFSAAYPLTLSSCLTGILNSTKQNWSFLFSFLSLLPSPPDFLFSIWLQCLPSSLDLKTQVFLYCLFTSRCGSLIRFYIVDLCSVSPVFTQLTNRYNQLSCFYSTPSFLVRFSVLLAGLLQ